MTNSGKKKCLNCGYERQPEDKSEFIPASECPKCRAIYEKVEKFIKEKEEKEKEKEKEKQTLEEKPPFFQRLKDKMSLKKGIAIAIGMMIVGALLNANGFRAIGIPFSAIGLMLVIPMLFVFVVGNIGESLIIVGVILLINSLNMDTTYEGVHNIGLLSQKQNFVIVSSVIFIAGILITSFKRFVKKEKNE